MERTVPSTASEEIELYQRTYYSLLRSTAEVKIRAWDEVHAGTNSLLHPAARGMKADMSAFIYSILRLPTCMPEVRLVVLGQSAEVFASAGYGDVSSWKEVYAPARRRRCYFDGNHTLACYIASRSDIDDVIPLLTAYQIEWNKLHNRLRRLPREVNLEELGDHFRAYMDLAETLEMPSEDLDRLYAIWQDDLGMMLERISEQPFDLSVRLLSGSLNEYRRARHAWWKNIESAAPELCERPIYFVSSNTHSLVNVLGGFARACQDELVRFLEEPGNRGLLNEWQDIQAGRIASSRENFFYYLLKKYRESSKGAQLLQAQQAHEATLGIRTIASTRSFDVEAQIIDLARLNPDWVDPRLPLHEWQAALERSEALILNIDYPLGLAAYDILTEVASHVEAILGVYVMGKAAALNGSVGDVMVFNVVHDEHSQNTYLFDNCFSAADIAPDLLYGTVLDNQKSMTVRGTFLQNADYMDVFYREGYTDIEMEAGPYLSAIYELYRPTRHPVNEIVNLYGVPFDLGFAHYVSDTPLSKGRNLAAGSLSYGGMDSTYAVTLAILRRILYLESKRLIRAA
jgi:hypothetical protein